MQILSDTMRIIVLKAGLTDAQLEIQDLIEDYKLETKCLERIEIYESKMSYRFLMW